MKVLIFPDAETAVDHVATTLVDTVAADPAAVLGLATGGTMDRVYLRTADLAQARGVRFDRVTSFNLDEYWGIPPEHPCAYAHYMRSRVFGPLGMDPARTHLPNGMAADPVVEAERYEAAIAAAGGIGLQILGLGVNGHIGFNEPTSSLVSRTRIKTLAEATRRANRRYFDRDEDVPHHALTMGIGSILDTRHCLLLALGPTKAEAVERMVEGPVSAMCPASALQMHRTATIVLDPEAASRLTLLEYYQRIHPDGGPAVVPVPEAGR